MRRHIEDDDLKAVFQWASHINGIKDIMIHIENERKCSHFQGKMRKKKGVRKGVSDIFLPKPMGEFHGLWIELKGPKNKVGYNPAPISIDQKIWLEKMTKLGYKAVVCYGFAEAVEAIKCYMGTNVPKIIELR